MNVEEIDSGLQFECKRTADRTSVAYYYSPMKHLLGTDSGRQLEQCHYIVATCMYNVDTKGTGKEALDWKFPCGR